MLVVHPSHKGWTQNRDETMNFQATWTDHEWGEHRNRPQTVQEMWNSHAGCCAIRTDEKADTCTQKLHPYKCTHTHARRLNSNHSFLIHDLVSTIPCISALVVSQACKVLHTHTHVSSSLPSCLLPLPLPLNQPFSPGACSRRALRAQNLKTARTRTHTHTHTHTHTRTHTQYSPCTHHPNPPSQVPALIISHARRIRKMHTHTHAHTHTNDTPHALTIPGACSHHQLREQNLKNAHTHTHKRKSPCTYHPRCLLSSSAARAESEQCTHTHTHTHTHTRHTHTHTTLPMHSPPQVPALIIGYARKVFKKKVWQRRAKGAVSKTRYGVPR